ncbi:hypothetical protein GWI33_001837 [Rhynchophorus ferrugineus]|uniref:Uncharacterized protein n=1 Tax=Rhynchophorus ferrugineus TaxID=354439 RepID=A0A834IN61_RHYFE|nr:hypothetical protein GWI33_001837 [Rhynchophorus ferrugineus]
MILLRTSQEKDGISCNGRSRHINRQQSSASRCCLGVGRENKSERLTSRSHRVHTPVAHLSHPGTAKALLILAEISPEICARTSGDVTGKFFGQADGDAFRVPTAEIKTVSRIGPCLRRILTRIL